jgi:hypothetical protein
MGLLEGGDEELDPSSGTGDYAIRFQTEIKIPCEGNYIFLIIRRLVVHHRV